MRLDGLRAAVIEDVARALTIGGEEPFRTAEAMVDSLADHIDRGLTISD